MNAEKGFGGLKYGKCHACENEVPLKAGDSFVMVNSVIAKCGCCDGDVLVSRSEQDCLIVKPEECYEGPVDKVDVVGQDFLLAVLNDKK